jgi:predicted nucleic acid-binding protein
LIVASHQQITREWWETQKDVFQLFLSQLVIDEVSVGDPAKARERLTALRNLPLLDITPEVAELASGILASGKIPRKAAADAAHIAIAAVHGMDFLLTWNCVHIANAVNARALGLICTEQGWDCPVICTPEELMGE